MADEANQKKTAGNGLFGQIVIAVAVALLVGSTAPWWWQELTDSEPPPEEVDGGLQLEEGLENLDRDELMVRQRELEQRLVELEQGIDEEVEAEPEVTSIADGLAVDLTGTWSSLSGNSYQIMQFGNEITIQEINPFYGVTAVGSGMIDGRDINISYTTASYTNGQAQLRLSENGSEISGTFTDLMTGFTVPAELYR